MGKTVHPLIIAGILGLLVCVALQIVGAVTSYWFKVKVYGKCSVFDEYGEATLTTVHQGLFQSCACDKCQNLDDISAYGQGIEVKDWLKAVTAFEILAIVTGGAAFLLVIVFIVKLQKEQLRTKTIPYLMLGVNMLAGCFSVLGCLIFRIKSMSEMWFEPQYLDFSFYLCLAAGILFILVGALFVIGGSKQVNMITATTSGVVYSAPHSQYPMVEQPGGMMLSHQPVWLQGPPGGQQAGTHAQYGAHPPMGYAPAGAAQGQFYPQGFLQYPAYQPSASTQPS